MITSIFTLKMFGKIIKYILLPLCSILLISYSQKSKYSNNFKRVLTELIKKQEYSKNKSQQVSERLNEKTDYFCLQEISEICENEDTIDKLFSISISNIDEEDKFINNQSEHDYPPNKPFKRV